MAPVTALLASDEGGRGRIPAAALPRCPTPANPTLMDPRLFASTFFAVLLAEMGDKTQLATMSLAAEGSSRWTVFAASALALVSASALAVLAGEAITRAVPPVWIKRGAGLLFIVLGLLMLKGSFTPDAQPPAQAPSGDELG